MLMTYPRVVALVSAIFLAFPVGAQELLKPVKLIVAQNGGTEVTRQFYGSVVARQTVDLAFQVGGQLQSIPVIEGVTVKQGELVAQLDLESFELALKQAKLQKEQADRTLARLKRLSGSTVSQVSIDDAATAAALADVAVKNAEFALNHATLYAPFDALVAARDVANYTTIAAGTPVVRLHDMSEIRIEVDIPEVLFLRADAAPDVELHAKFPSSDKIFPAQLREFNAETSKVGQSYRVTLGMTPPKGVRILPGASATVIATIKGEHKDAILLPKTAVFVDAAGKPSVLVFAPKGASEGTLSKRNVTVAQAPEGGILVVSGLEPGLEIVAAGGAALEDGQKVRRFAGFGN
ncbi:efflux RND transporter periplasmic adaptor subunit [Rhodobacteraceae bacterium D3-12]|nr:efflux RND transporter periplasmic adaptor subunit [Rhodobacteraceae bacterium D3-12]